MGTDEHPLLTRLLRKTGARAGEVPTLEAWNELLRLVERTYHEADQDRYTLERSIDISSREMQGLYQDLKRSSDKRIEESYAVLRATLEAASAGIVVVDATGKLFAMNQRFVDMMGIPAHVVARGDYDAMLVEKMARVVDSEAARRRSEEMGASDGTLRDELELHDGRTIERYGAPVRLPDGTVVGRVTFYVDITGPRAARVQLETAWAAAEAASDAKSMFLANMSHELRTPLNAVLGLADLMLLETGDPTTPRQREYLDAIIQSGRHLLALVNDVLDVAKLESGKHDLELEDTVVTEAVEEALGTLVPLAHQRGVSLAAQLASGSAVVRADRLRLRQILYNLISNALKFTDRGGHVTVAAAADGEHVVLSVADSGIGIADADLPRLYRAFEQLLPATGDRPPGTGLGLALTKRLVVSHGWSIDVRSEVGVGTTFTVRMPAA